MNAMTGALRNRNGDVEEYTGESGVWFFESTGAAYDATQTDERINKGDVLVIDSEQVVGIADTWPIAVTIQAGKLHTPAEGTTLQQCCATPGCDITEEHIAAAKKAANDRGWPTID